MSQVVRALLLSASLVVIAAVANTDDASARQWYCHACLSQCVAIFQVDACRMQCSSEPANLWQCFDDDYDYCPNPDQLITACIVDPDPD
jgi:hypothetical protein